MARLYNISRENYQDIIDNTCYYEFNCKGSELLVGQYPPGDLWWFTCQKHWDQYITNNKNVPQEKYVLLRIKPKELTIIGESDG